MLMGGCQVNRGQAEQAFAGAGMGDYGAIAHPIDSKGLSNYEAGHWTIILCANGQKTPKMDIISWVFQLPPRPAAYPHLENPQDAQVMQPSIIRIS